MNLSFRYTKYYKQISVWFAGVFSALLMCGCIEDGIDTSPSAQPVFSTDTLHLGEYFTAEPIPTARLMVYNRHNKIINISRIEFDNPEQASFRINVDGQSGSAFSNIEIRPNDSIYVLVESTLPVNGESGIESVCERLRFLTNGVVTSVVLEASGEDARRVNGDVIDADTRWDSAQPYLIRDSLVVAPGATLTLEPGCRLYFHDKAFMRVEGTLRSEGDAGCPVTFTGDRRGNVVSDIPFDLMASQWDGLYFASSSRDNVMQFTEVKNSCNGVVLDSVGVATDAPVLTLRNCRLRNSAGYSLAALWSSVDAEGCEIADASWGVMFLQGGKHRFVNCTFANYYLFTALRGPAITFENITADDGGDVVADVESQLAPLSARFDNCIIYGNGRDLSHTDLADTDVWFRNCLFKSAGSDDDHFVDILWDTDPLYYTERSEYIFDYRLRPDSPAAEAASTELLAPGTDFYGTPRRASLGAYEYTEDAMTVSGSEK